MQFIDTHIHLQDFKSDFAPKVLANPDIKRLVVVSAVKADFAKVAALMNSHPDKIVGAFGIHPWSYREEVAIEALKNYLKAFPEALVGEIGVDGIKEKPGEEQKALFSAQMSMAKEFKRPVVLHAAKAFAALTLFEKELKEVKFVYHGYVKNRELLKFILKCGGYIGLGAHFLKQGNAVELWHDMPKDRVLFETDAPYQTSDEDYNDTVQERMAGFARISKLSAHELEGLFIKNAEDFLRC